MKRGRDTTIGWVTDEAVAISFPPRIIVNGQLPPDYEVEIVSPKSQTPTQLKPGESFQATIVLRIIDSTSPNADVAPAFVSLWLIRGKKAESFSVLEGTYSDQRKFTYAGEILAPVEPGVYELRFRVEYAVADPKSSLSPLKVVGKGNRNYGGLGGNSHHRKEFRGHKIHVTH